MHPPLSCTLVLNDVSLSDYVLGVLAKNCLPQIEYVFVEIQILRVMHPFPNEKPVIYRQSR